MYIHTNYVYIGMTVYIGLSVDCTVYILVVIMMNVLMIYIKKRTDLSFNSQSLPNTVLEVFLILFSREQWLLFLGILQSNPSQPVEVRSSLIVGFCLPASCSRRSIVTLLQEISNVTDLTENYLHCSKDRVNEPKSH